MASAVQICNRALQKLGAKRITSLTEDSPNARSCNVAYDDIREAELRAHTWNCAVKRAQLAEDSDTPLFGKSARFQLPSDFLRLLPKDPEENLNTIDFQIEQNYIYTNFVAPLDIRYIFNLEDPNVMDTLLREAIAARIAMELCEEITQSNTKRGLVEADYKRAISVARKTNAIERVAQDPPDDTWITVRN